MSTSWGKQLDDDDMIGDDVPVVAQHTFQKRNWKRIASVGAAIVVGVVFLCIVIVVAVQQRGSDDNPVVMMTDDGTTIPTDMEERVRRILRLGPLVDTVRCASLLLFMISVCNNRV
jgi:hypothetical protein